MKATQKKLFWTIFLIVAILFIDQFSKIWVKLHMTIGDYYRITDWFYIYFTENPGMAFGLEIIDKLLLTLFRIAAAGALIWYLQKIIRNNHYNLGFTASIALIFAGAAGNILDCLFYGIFFTSSYGQVAEFLPQGGGYAPFFYGQVVDMLWFPLIHDASGDTLFFRPIFNIADSAISVGVGILILFQRKYLQSQPQEEKPKE